MTKRLHIVASCSDRKSRAVPAKLRLRDVESGKSASATVSSWWQRLSDADVEAIPARSLYKGDHWSVVSKLQAAATGYETELWVSSAGYGLVHASTPIKPYSATFATKQDDSVHRFETEEARGNDLLINWWHSLADHRFSQNIWARTLTALLKNDPDSWVLIVAGPQYLRAMATDLAQAVQQLSDPDRLLVVSSSEKPLPTPVRDNWIPSNAKLQAKLGGSLSSLHARVAQRILSESSGTPLSASALQKQYRREIDELEGAKPGNRIPLSDEAVRAFIESRLDQNKGRSYTSLLRELRNNQLACEQKRFKSLYSEIAHRNHHAT